MASRWMVEEKACIFLTFCRWYPSFPQSWYRLAQILRGGLLPFRAGVKTEINLQKIEIILVGEVDKVGERGFIDWI